MLIDVSLMRQIEYVYVIKAGKTPDVIGFP